MERQSDYRDIKAGIDENWVLSVIQQSCINTFRLAQASIRSALRHHSILNHIDHIRVLIVPRRWAMTRVVRPWLVPSEQGLNAKVIAKIKAYFGSRKTNIVLDDGSTHRQIALTQEELNGLDSYFTSFRKDICM